MNRCRLTTSAARSRAGMTLLELILALGITSILALTLYTSLRTAFMARDRAHAVVGPVRGAAVALDLIGRDLQTALPPTGILAGPFYGAFGADVPDGEAILEFYSIGGDSFVGDPNFSAIRRVTLALVTMEDGDTALVRRVNPNLLAMIESEGEEEVLCRRVNSVNLLYLQGDQWVESWDSTALEDALPGAIEVSLEMNLEDDPVPYRMARTFLLPASVPLSAEESDEEAGDAAPEGGGE